MSSLPPDDGHEPYLDDEDTGPLHVETPEHSADDDWDPVPAPNSANSAWADRFQGPLSVSPRPIPTRTAPDRTIVLRVAGTVVGLAIIGGLIYWLTRPSSDEPQTPTAAPSSTSTTPTTSTASDEDQARLTKALPRGYPADACEPAEPPKGTLAQVNCGPNTDPDGPQSAIYTLTADKAALDAAFTDITASAQRVNCPGNIQSPGPWRRNAAPQIVAGTLFCGLREGQPTVVWTDDAKLVINAVQSDPQGPTFPALYAWWSSHS